MKVRKPNVLKQLYAKFVTQARKKDMVWIFETYIFLVQELKGITKVNVILIINWFYLNNYIL
jgi:hypothetical protein